MAPHAGIRQGKFETSPLTWLMSSLSVRFFGVSRKHGAVSTSDEHYHRCPAVTLMSQRFLKLGSLHAALHAALHVVPGGRPQVSVGERHCA